MLLALPALGDADTPPEAAAAQKQLSVVQWVLPALTAAMIVVDALHGELQRPSQSVSGILAKPAKLLGLND